MHIAEGLLPKEYIALYSLAAGVFIAKGGWDYSKRSREFPMTKQLTGVMTAAVFIISLLPIPVPIAGTSSHPGGTPLAAILMGPFIPTVMSLVALFFQALFLAHGGLTTLGANTLTMGVFGGTIGFIIWYCCRKIGLSIPLSAGLAGFLGDISIYLGTSSQLALAIHGDSNILKVFELILMGFLPTQLPLAVLEGIFTALVLKFLIERRPDILIRLKVVDKEELIGYTGLTMETKTPNEISVPIAKGLLTNQKWKIFLVVGLIFLVVVGVLVFGKADYQGADVSVTALADQFARKVGAGSRDPFINTDKGDLLLFLFAFSGLVSGFFLGYQWRSLFPAKESILKNDK